MIYFTADLHFGNEAVLKIDNRPYGSVEEMDADLIRRWNEKVEENDTVFIMGDFIHRPQKGYRYYLERLNGKIILILGNHDRGMLEEIYTDGCKEKYFEAVSQYGEIELLEQGNKVNYYLMENLMTDLPSKPGEKLLSTDKSCKIVLSHYPMLGWNGYYRGFWLIHGHIHAHKQESHEWLKYEDRALNAGCQITDYASATFEELVRYNEKFKERENMSYANGK